MWFEALQLVVVVAALGLTAWQVRVQRIRQVEDFYLQRFWNLMDRLSEPALTCRVSAGGVKEDDRRAIRLYFRLSEDEADGRANGWVSRATWHIWRGAIRNQMKREPYRSLWERAVADSEAGRDYRFFHLKRIVAADGESYDPRAGNRLGRIRRMSGRTATSATSASAGSDAGGGRSAHRPSANR